MPFVQVTMLEGRTVEQKQALYLAINCSAGKLNATGADGNWKQWSGPKSSFEKDLLKDRCKAKA